MERKNIWNLYSDEQILELKEINDKVQALPGCRKDRAGVRRT